MNGVKERKYIRTPKPKTSCERFRRTLARIWRDSGRLNGPRSMALSPVETPETQEISLFERLARDPAVTVDNLERLMQLHERAQARRAKEAFNVAMSAAQKAIRPVVADAENTQTHNKYASYEAIDRAIRPIYTEHGFALSFNTGDAPLPEHVRVLCDVTHIAGHEKAYRVDMPADGKGAKGGDVMTKTHASGSAMSYGQRYLVKLIFNIAVADDDDGNKAGQATPPPKTPDGFVEWWEGLADVVTEGMARYYEVWKAGTQVYRDYVKATCWPEHEARKVKAAKADQERKR